ncbi:hypothetical protein [Algoriphagus namhaensis]
MKYFELKNVPNKSLIRDYLDKRKVGDPANIWNFEDGCEIKGQPIVPAVLIDSRVKIPDLFKPGGPLSPRTAVSGQLRAVLEKAGANQCMQFFPLELIQKEKLLKDYWMTNFTSFSNHLIDFDKSVFIEVRAVNIATKSYLPPKYACTYLEKRLKNLDDLESQKKMTKAEKVLFHPERIYLKDDVATDVVLIKKLSIFGIVVSEKLKNIIEEKGFVGVGYKPLDMNDEEWHKLVISSFKK